MKTPKKYNTLASLVRASLPACALLLTASFVVVENLIA